MASFKRPKMVSISSIRLSDTPDVRIFDQNFLGSFSNKSLISAIQSSMVIMNLSTIFKTKTTTIKIAIIMK